MSGTPAGAALNGAALTCGGCSGVPSNLTRLKTCCSSAATAVSGVDGSDCAHDSQARIVADRRIAEIVADPHSLRLIQGCESSFSSCSSRARVSGSFSSCSSRAGMAGLSHCRHALPWPHCPHCHQAFACHSHRLLSCHCGHSHCAAVSHDRFPFPSSHSHYPIPIAAGWLPAIASGALQKNGKPRLRSDVRWNECSDCCLRDGTKKGCTANAATAVSAMEQKRGAPIACPGLRTKIATSI
jgi:hypothetical protein